MICRAIHSLRSRITFVTLICLWSLTIFLFGQAPSLPDHSFQPNTTFTSPQTAPYGLTDLDNFSAGNYGYCKWGNLMSEGYRDDFSLLISLPFTWLTNPPFNGSNQDLFLFKNKTTLVPLAIPVSDWTPPVGATSGSLAFPYTALPFSSVQSDPSTWVALMRKLHFSNTPFTDTNGTPVTTDQLQNIKKAIILIHGWNPDSDPISCAPYASAEWTALTSSLAIALEGASDWRILEYHWEADADTGGLDFPQMDNPISAAEIAHRHGQHLGELLAKLSPNGNLTKVHFITHSAGTWAARSAARYLTTNNTSCKVQITLLDPFIPSHIWTANSALSVSIINTMPQMDGNNSGQLYLLENYFAVDALHTSPSTWLTDSDAVFGATSGTFVWRSNRDVNLRVDRTDGTNPPYYRSHAGPIQFYADTVLNPTLNSSTPGLQSPSFQGWTLGVGWKQSMFYNEPPAPASLSAATVSSTQINISWQNNSNKTISFKIERAPNANGPWSQIATTAATVTSYSDLQGVASTTYYYRVTAIGVYGDDSNPSNVANAATQATVSATHTLTVISVIIYLTKRAARVKVPAAVTG